MYIKLFLPCLFFLILLWITKPCLNTCILRVHVQMNCIKALYLLVQFCLSQWTSKDILTQSIHAPSSPRLKKPKTRGGRGTQTTQTFFLIEGRALFHFYNFLSPIRPKDGLCDKHVHVLPIRWKCDLVTVHLFITNRPVRELQNMFCMLTSVE